jgi:hypothetical protein
MPVAAPRRDSGITSPTTRHHDRAEYASAQAGKRARQQQGLEIRSQGTAQVRQCEQGIHRKQQAPAIEAVDICGREQAGQSGAPRVRGDRGRKRRRPDGEGVHDLRPERHHHHEIHDDGELGQRKQPE